MKTPAVTSPSVTAGSTRCLTESTNAFQSPLISESTVYRPVCVSIVACTIGLARSEVGSQPRYDPKKSCAMSPRKKTGIA